MDNRFFTKPILNSPYEHPSRHWELDAQGQPTQQIIETRRRAEQKSLLFDEGKGLTTQAQRYDHTAIINSVRQQVDRWLALPNSNDWRVTPETARLLQHWRHHKFSSIPSVLLSDRGSRNRHLPNRSRAAGG
jgi:type III restriction enzyme